MKMKVVVDLDISQRKVLQKYIGKSKGIRPIEYREALVDLICNHINEQKKLVYLNKSA